MQVAEVFNNVIERTQPNYTIMQRPEILRSTNAVTKMFTMFMTQRLQNLNILYDASITYSKMRRDYKAGKNGVTFEDKKRAKAKLARAVSSQLLQAAVIVGMGFLSKAILHKMNPFRDDDEDITGEKIGAWLLSEYINTLMGSVVAGSEIYEAGASILTGGTYYGISTNGIDTIKDFLSNTVKLLQEVKDGEKTGKNFAKVTRSLAEFAGIPLKNAESLVNMVRYHKEDIANGKFLSYEAGVKRTYNQNLHHSWAAYKAGNTSRAGEIMESMKEQKVQEYIDKGKTEEEAKKEAYTYLRQLIRAYLRDDYLRLRQSYYHSNNKDENDYKRLTLITNFMTASNLYVKPDVKKTIDKWWDDATEEAEKVGITMEEYLSDKAEFDLRQYLSDAVTALLASTK